MYMRKEEPAIRGLRDDLIKPNMIATISFLTDVLASTNALQTFLQGERLNFLQLPAKVERLITALRAIAANPMSPRLYFSRIQEFINIASQSAGARYQSRSYREFDLDRFKDTVIKPFIKALIKEIEKAFEIPEHLKGFSVLDPLLIPRDIPTLGTYGIESIESFAVFYGSNCVLPNNTYPPIVDSENLKHQFKVFKTFVIKHRLEWENTQSQLLLTAQQKLSGYKTELDTLDSLLTLFMPGGGADVSRSL